MSSGSSKIKYWEYYGSIAGVVCAGPVDVLEEVIIDGESVWQGPLVRDPARAWESVTIDARRVLRIYWGTESQPVDPILMATGNNAGHAHPDYRGWCYVVLVDFFFGKEKTSAPNLEVVVSRQPQQAVFTSGAAGLHDGQASPVATLADWLTHPRYGLGLAVARFAEVSWFAAADELFLDAQHGNTYVSALLNQQGAARGAVAEMALHADLWLRHNAATDEIEVGVWPHDATVAVGALPLVTADDLTERPRLEAEGWSETETGWTITFADRERDYKESAEKHDDLRALRIVGEHRRQTLKRPWVMRREQAFWHVTEYGKRMGVPLVSGQLTVRRAKGLEIRPGDLLRVDIDPEPGGAQLQQVCRVLERTVPQTGPLVLRVEAETGIAPVLYVPAADVPDGQVAFVPPAVVHQRVWELPLGAVDSALRIGLLVERPHELVTGVTVHYSDNPAAKYGALGVQETFAVRGRVTTGWTADVESDGAFEVEVLSPFDRELLEDDPGPTAARNGELLMVVCELAADGQIAEDGYGLPLLEVYSVEAFTLVSGSTYAVTATRGWWYTRRRAFSADAEVWLVPGFGVTGFGHGDWENSKRESLTAYLRLAPYTLFTQREVVDCLDVAYAFPALYEDIPTWVLDEPSSASVVYADPPGLVTVRGLVQARGPFLRSFEAMLGSRVLTTQVLGAADNHVYDFAVPVDARGAHLVTLSVLTNTGRRFTSEISMTVLSASEQVAQPVITPTSQSIPREGIDVRVSCATPGALIDVAILTKDNITMEPDGPGWDDDWWTRYTEPIYLIGNRTYRSRSGSTTTVSPYKPSRIWARAYAPGKSQSEYSTVYFS